jgi:uncharacterized membrane protein YeaQ/YmgE (transglycosylase-associated protein family)
MSFIPWIILGFVTGFFASKIVNKTSEVFVLDNPLGVVGARISDGNTHEK